MVLVASHSPERQSSTKIIELLRPNEPSFEPAQLKQSSYTLQFHPGLAVAFVQDWQNAYFGAFECLFWLGWTTQKCIHAICRLLCRKFEWDISRATNFSPTLSSISKTAFILFPKQNNAAFLAPSVVMDMSFILIRKAAIDATRKEAACYNIDA